MRARGGIMIANNDILIAGGYGTVGVKIAANLAQDYPGQVVIAGRNLEKATRVASELGHGVRARYIDVRERDSVDKAMDGIGTVMSCVAQPETPHLLLASVSRGCAYTDIAPMALKRPAYPNTLKAEAVDTGARIILGTGMVPGISNIFARMGADRVGPVDSVASACLLSVGDEYGSDSKGFIAEEIVTAFETTINGEKVLVKPFTGPKRIEFPPPLGALTAYLFPFSDQIYYPVTLGARTAVSRLALLPQWVPGLLSALLPLAGSTLAKRRSRTSGRLGGLMDWLKRRYRDLDWWGVHVEVLGAGGIQKASVQGHGQARATALSASAFLRALIEDEVDRAGIWTAEQVVPVGPFLARLAAHGLVPTVT
ncbi:MAG TPA: saccharopine dehydrogenase NADP-binding domain-containing protein [bacterium]|nr:saccharopine dehydrogenase NADP-binding domain-containing protein [bacterium]